MKTFFDLLVKARKSHTDTLAKNTETRNAAEDQYEVKIGVIDLDYDRILLFTAGDDAEAEVEKEREADKAALLPHKAQADAKITNANT